MRGSAHRRNREHRDRARRSPPRVPRIPRRGWGRGRVNPSRRVNRRRRMTGSSDPAARSSSRRARAHLKLRGPATNEGTWSRRFPSFRRRRYLGRQVRSQLSCTSRTSRQGEDWGAEPLPGLRPHRCCRRSQSYLVRSRGRVTGFSSRLDCPGGAGARRGRLLPLCVSYLSRTAGGAAKRTRPLPPSSEDKRWASRPVTARPPARRSRGISSQRRRRFVWGRLGGRAASGPALAGPLVRPKPSAGNSAPAAISRPSVPAWLPGHPRS